MQKYKFFAFSFACSIYAMLFFSLKAQADESFANRPVPESALDTPSAFDEQFKEAQENEVFSMEDFVRGTKAQLNLRNYYFNRTKPEAPDPIAWAQGGSLQLNIGRIGGIVSLAVEQFGSYRLVGEEDHDGTLLLESGQDNINVLGVLNPRIQIFDNVISLYRRKFEMPYINGQDSRMIPNTFEGYVIGMPSAANDKLQYVAGYIDKIKTRGSDSFVSMSEAAGVSNADRGTIVAAARAFPLPEISLSAANYYTQDVLNVSYGEAVYKAKLSESLANALSFQASNQSSVGSDLLTGQAYSADMWGFQEAISYRSFTLKFAFNANDAGGVLQNPWGSYPGYNSSIVENFNEAGQNSWQIGAAYDFKRAGIDGLSINAAYVDANSAKNPSTKEHLPDISETDISLNYKLPAGLLKGFWLRGQTAVVRQQGQSTTREHRIVLNYQIPLWEPAAAS